MKLRKSSSHLCKFSLIYIKYTQHILVNKFLVQFLINHYWISKHVLILAPGCFHTVPVLIFEKMPANFHCYSLSCLSRGYFFLQISMFLHMKVWQNFLAKSQLVNIFILLAIYSLLQILSSGIIKRNYHRK